MLGSIGSDVKTPVNARALTSVYKQEQRSIQSILLLLRLINKESSIHSFVIERQKKRMILSFLNSGLQTLC